MPSYEDFLDHWTTHMGTIAPITTPDTTTLVLQQAKFQRWLATGRESGPLTLGAEPERSAAMLWMVREAGEKVLRAAHGTAHGQRELCKPAIMALAAYVASGQSKDGEYAQVMLTRARDLFWFCQYVEEMGWNAQARIIVAQWYSQAQVGEIIIPQLAAGWNHQRVLERVVVAIRDESRQWLVDWILGTAKMDDPKASSTALAIERVREPMRARLRAKLVEHYGIPLRLLPDQKLRSEKFWRELRVDDLSLDEVLEHFEMIVKTKESIALSVTYSHDLLKIIALWQRTSNEAVKATLGAAVAMNGKRWSYVGNEAQLVLGSTEPWVVGLVFWMLASFAKVTVRRGGTLGKIYLPSGGTIEEWSGLVGGLDEEIDLGGLAKKLKVRSHGMTMIVGDKVTGEIDPRFGPTILLRSPTGKSIEGLRLEMIGEFNEEAARAVVGIVRGREWS